MSDKLRYDIKVVFDLPLGIGPKTLGMLPAPKNLLVSAIEAALSGIPRRLPEPRNLKLSSGLRDIWCPALMNSKVGGKSVRQRMLDEELGFWLGPDLR